MNRNHVVLPGNTRPAKQDAVRVRDADPNSHVEVTVTLRGPALPDPDALPSRPLRPEELEADFGANSDDIEKVKHILEGYGLTVEDVSPATRSMRVSGTSSSIEGAFQPHLGIYHSAEQGEFRGREGEIKVPTELADIVTGVFGLDQRQVAYRKSHSFAHDAAAMPTLPPLTPADLENRYKFPPGDGKDQQIAIAEFGGGYFPDDLNAFCVKHNRRVPTVNIVEVNLKALTLQEIKKLPKDQQIAELDMTGEVMMDVQIVAGLCPKAAISVYFATFDQKGWVDMLDRVIKARPVTVSISWGLAEDSSDWSDAARTAVNDRLHAAALLGVTVCASSGDDGSGDQVSDGRAHVDFPSSSPYVLGVGGTMLTGTEPESAEQVWWEAPGQRTNNGGGSTGGGVSVFFPRPGWQNVKVQSLNSDSIDGRVVPDVAALAGPPLYDLTLLGDDAPNGGTSASTPLWAALVARINAALPADKQQRFLTPLLYQSNGIGKSIGATTFVDITLGNNISNPQPGVGYDAGEGYDAVTGWGVPDGVALLGGL